MLKKNLISTKEGLKSISISDILRCEAQGKNTICFMKNETTYISNKSLKNFEEQLFIITLLEFIILI